MPHPRLLRLLLGCLLGGLLLARSPLPARAQAAGEEVPAPSGRWVTDQADLLTDAEEQALTATLRGYADTTSTQIVIVTLPSLDGGDPAMMATELGERWGVGQAEQDNGIVILVSREDRQLFIAIGKGLEGAIPDVIAGRIRRDIMVPAFRQGQFYAGLSGAVDALVAAARGEYRAEPAERSSDDGGGGGFGILVVILIIMLISRISRGGGKGGGRRRFRSFPGIPPVIIWGGGWGGGGGGGWGGGGGFGGGGFSGGGGSFGGGGAGGSW